MARATQRVYPGLQYRDARAAIAWLGRAFGFEPVRIETREGREEYVAGQRELARRAAPVRERLLTECRRLERLIQPDCREPDTSSVNSPSSASRRASARA